MNTTKQAIRLAVARRRNFDRFQERKRREAQKRLLGGAHG